MVYWWVPFQPLSLRRFTEVILQLHRCSVIYSMNYWVMAFPCLIYLASVGMFSGTARSDSNMLS